MDWSLRYSNLSYFRLSPPLFSHRALYFTIKMICLLIALLLLTACDKEEKERVGAEQAQARDVIYKVLKSSHFALCGPKPKEMHTYMLDHGSAYNRRDLMSKVFASELTQPAIDFMKESPATCDERFPRYDFIDDNFSILFDGDNADAGMYFKPRGGDGIPVKLKRDPAGLWRISFIDFDMLRSYAKTGKLPDGVDDSMRELKQKVIEQKALYPAPPLQRPNIVAPDLSQINRLEPAGNNKQTPVIQTNSNSDNRSEPSTWWETTLLVLKIIGWVIGTGLLIFVYMVFRYGIFGGHRTFNSQCKKDAKLSQMSPELWPLAVGAPYAVATDYNWCTIAATDQAQAAESKQSAADGLSSAWGIYSRDSLLNQLFWLLVEGHRTDYLQQINDDCSLSHQEYAQYAAQLASEGDSDSKERLWQLNVARKNKRKICRLNFYAWDMVRFVMLCHSGARSGYISEQEMKDFSLLAATELQKHCQSWKEMGKTFLLARWFWKATDKRHLFSHYLFKKAISALLRRRGSPWRILDWNTPLPTHMSIEQFAIVCHQVWAPEPMPNEDNNKVADKTVH